MHRTEEWYRKFIQATFRRGQAPELPLSYIEGQIEKTLKEEEADEAKQVLRAMIEDGAVERRGDDTFALPAKG